MEVAASIVGLLTAAAKVYTTLSAFLSVCRDAPVIAQTTSDEVRDFHYALLKLRDYVWQSKNITPLGRATTDTGQLILTLASAMTTLAQVEKTLDPLLAQPKKMDYIRRIRWGFADSDLSKLLTRIQSHKLTLNLLLTIWLSESVAQSEASNDLLNDTLKGLLDPRYLSRLQSFDPSLYDLSVGDILHGNAPGDISHTATPVNPGASDTTCVDNISLMTVNKTFSIVSERSLKSKLLNTRPYARLKAFDSSAQSVLTSQRATPWSEFTIGSNTSVFSLPFTGLDLDKRAISEVKEIHRISLPIDGMELYNDWRYPELNNSIKHQTTNLCILLSIFGIEAKEPKTTTDKSVASPTDLTYVGISSSSHLRSLNQELARCLRTGGQHSIFLKSRLMTGITRNDLQSIDLLLSLSAQRRFGPAIGDVLVDTFREVVREGNTHIAERFLDWGSYIEVPHREPDYGIFEIALESRKLDLINLFLIYGVKTERGYGNPAYTPLQRAIIDRDYSFTELLLHRGVDIQGSCDDERRPPLDLAIEVGNYEMITLLLSHGANAESAGGRVPPCTPFQAAAMGFGGYSLGVVSFLLNRGVNIEGNCCEEPRKPLELAMEAGNYSMIRTLIDHGASLEKGYGEPPLTPLQAVALERYPHWQELALCLLEGGVNIEGNCKEEPKTPLELAMEAGKYSIVTMLLDHGASPEKGYGEPPLTPLQAAALERYPHWHELALCLLERGVNIEGDCKEEPKRPLELAMEAGNYSIVTMLLDHGANLEKAYGEPPLTPLQAVALERYPHWQELALCLLEGGVNIEGNCKEEPKTPLELAMEAGKYSMIRTLIDHGASPEKGYGRPPLTPLQAAVLKRYPHWQELALCLLERGVNMEGNCKEEPKRPLELAMEAGNYKMIALLLNNGANPDEAYGSPLYTPLQAAALERYPHWHELALCLLEQRVNIEGNCKEEPKKPLELAMEAGNYSIVTMLLDHGANLEKAYGEPPLTPLQAAVLERYPHWQELALCLLEGGVNIEGNCKEEPKTPLELAMEAGKYSMIRKLIDHGASPEKGYGRPPLTPLQAAVLERYPHWHELALCLLEGGVNIEGNCKEEPKRPLELAMEAGNYKMITLLLNNGADPDEAYGSPLCTPLQKAAIGLYNDPLCFARSLLDGRANIDGCCKGESRTPLQLAILYGSSEMISLLLDRGAKPDVGYPYTLLQIAAMRKFENSSHIAQLLLAGRAYTECHTAKEPRTPLQISIDNNDHAMIDLFLAAGADLNKYYGQQRTTPLQKAIHKEDCALIQKLLGHGANTEMGFDDPKRTPLQAIASMQSPSFVGIARMLVGSGAVVDGCTDGVRRTPLEIAIESRQVPMALFLIDVGANVEKYHYKSFMTPMQLAAKYGDAEITTKLLDRGANLDGFTEKVPSTALQIAVQMESEEVVRVLTRRGANVESCCEGSPKTPLQIAVEIQSKNIVRILLKAGAKQQSCTREFMCPLHMALVAGSEELVEILSCEDVNIPTTSCDQYLTEHCAVHLVD